MKIWLVCLSVFCLFWQRGLSQSTQAPINPVTGKCGATGYDISSLISEKYWTIDLKESSEWLVPTDVEFDEVAKAVVYISACQPLPAGTCGDVNDQSTVCQQLTLTNGTTLYFDMGTFNDSVGFKPIEDNIDGFFGVREGKAPVETRTCINKRVSTLLNFHCDLLANWTNSAPNVSQYANVTSVISCNYIISLKYVGACYVAPTVSPASCQLDSYDTKTLAAQSYWHATVPHTACYNGTEDILCIYLFSFCHPLPKDDSRYDLNSCYKQQASVCQIGQTEGTITHEYNSGTFQNYTRFYENANAVNGGFHMVVENGSKPENGTKCKQGFNSRVILTCDASVTWPDNGDLSEIIEVSYVPGDDPCQFIISLPYKGACVTQFPVQEPPSPVGWIFIGLFLAAIAIYMAVGMSIQYFGKGARGVDVIPNYTFWAYLFGLIMEGSKFSLDLITCYQCRKGVIARPTGVEYDKI